MSVSSEFEQRNEQCRQIAEWLGWTRFRQEVGFECLYWIGKPPNEVNLKAVPDFHGEEWANALIRDKLLDEGCAWTLNKYRVTLHYSGEPINVYRLPVKEAIVEAALQYRFREGEPSGSNDLPPVGGKTEA